MYPDLENKTNRVYMDKNGNIYDSLKALKEAKQNNITEAEWNSLFKTLVESKNQKPTTYASMDDVPYGEVLED